jgi:large subunit ribosomal protein L6
MFAKEVSIPEKVSVEISGPRIEISGEQGKVVRNFDLQLRGTDLKIEKVENKIKIFSAKEDRETKALIGTIAAHIRNMIEGVSKGYTYKLKIVYSHFPITVKVEGDKVLIQNFLGERVPRVAKILGQTKVRVEGQDVYVSGIDLDEVSQTAANIEQACRIVGYDRRTFPDGIFIVSKGA